MGELLAWTGVVHTSDAKLDLVPRFNKQEMEFRFRFRVSLHRYKMLALFKLLHNS